jgi:hypothetical protein
MVSILVQASMQTLALLDTLSDVLLLAHTNLTANLQQ